MTRHDKNNAIENLKEALGEIKNLYFADIAGLDAIQTSALRRACFKENIKLQVVKNTLLAKAMEASNYDFGELREILKGNTSLMYSESGNAPAKVIKSFRKKSDKPILKGAFIEEAIYIGDEQLEALVAIKSKNELIGEIITLLQSPTKNVVSALQSGGGKLSGILKSLSER
ncbi:MAG: 50S ribosomal protein L10 [Flavobacteriaceae bacterium TMED179]|nr:MAG: 50S ribosomal protein L10 [Flavobacteriaceae bacterium TMED179]|tara:strand:+ start:12979 stop:13494 length:516 start_codon:yes stop_codon:yes gene_type:complete